MAGTGGFDMRIAGILSSDEYAEAMRAARRFLEMVQGAAVFRLDSVLREADLFFFVLKRDSPEIYRLIEVQEREIYEAAFKKRFGKSMMMG